MESDDAKSYDSPSSAGSGDAQRDDHAMLQIIEDARKRLHNLELSCHSILDTQPSNLIPCASPQVQPPLSPLSNQPHEVELLKQQVAHLKRQLVASIQLRESSDRIFQRAMAYASAKGTANAVLHTLFDQASAAKYQVLESWWETGVIPTRDGLKHWRLDVRSIRNETGASLLHVAVDASIARQNLKVKMVELLVDTIGFDVNIRDVFGRTPLHVAAMAGLAEVAKALLERGANALLRDRAGLTPLSLVRTLSKPPEEVVQVLMAAETKLMKAAISCSSVVSKEAAVSAAVFLASMDRFVLQHHADAFKQQAIALLKNLQQANGSVHLNKELQQVMPILFETDDHHATAAPVLTRLETLFNREMFHDPAFIENLKIEAATYSFSSVTSVCPTAGALAGATWDGMLLKLIAAYTHEADTVASGTTPIIPGGAVSTTDVSSVSAGPCSPRSDSSLASSERGGGHHARQAWHYAVLMKCATQPLPGVLSVKKGDQYVTCSEDVCRLFPLEDRLIIGSSEFHCVSYDPSSRVIELDRAYEGPNDAAAKAYLAGSTSSLYPPYITAKRLWEREPGNKYEEHMSAEQELFQDYQFLDPDSEFEVTVKLGPVPTTREARALVEEWRAQTRKLFDEKKCLSGMPCCTHYCPQRNGHSLCVDTMAAVGRDLAKERLGRPTFSKQLKPRAALQKYQNLFQGSSPWPGSPSSTRPASEAVESPRMTPMDLDLT